jgi:hypothetical protein
LGNRREGGAAASSLNLPPRPKPEHEGEKSLVAIALRMVGGRAPVGEPSWEHLWPTLSTPVVRPRQPQTNKRKCGNQPADQSL